MPCILNSMSLYFLSTNFEKNKKLTFLCRKNDKTSSFALFQPFKKTRFMVRIATKNFTAIFTPLPTQNRPPLSGRAVLCVQFCLFLHKLGVCGCTRFCIYGGKHIHSLCPFAGIYG